MEGYCPSCRGKGAIAAPCEERVCAANGYHFVPAAGLERTGSSLLDRDQLVGRKIDEYLVVDKLGEGGFGTVYLTLQTPIMMQTALKLLKNLARTGLDPALLAGKFQQEARALATLSHPNIVRLIKYGTFENIPYMVMEYVDRARNLKDEVTARALAGRTFSLPEVRHIMTQLLHALAAAHGRDLVHRDVKPENIMLQRVEGDPLLVRVLDFGLAKVVSEPGDTTMVQGTPTYMAPEQLRGKDFGPWTDLYAAGTILFELLAGKRLFPEASTHEMLANKMNPGFDPLDGLDASTLPSYVVEFVASATCANPAGRIRSAVDFMTSLERLFSRLSDDGHDIPASSLTSLLSSSRPLGSEGVAPAASGAGLSGEAETWLAQADAREVSGDAPTWVAEAPVSAGEVSAEGPTWLAPDSGVSSRVLEDGPTVLASGGQDVSGTVALAGPQAKSPATDPRHQVASATGWSPGRWVLIVLAAATLSAAGYFALSWTGVLGTPEPASVTLTVVTDPPDAEVLSGDKSLGTTPLSVELDPGKYDFTIRRAGFLSEKLGREYEGGEEDQVAMKLRRGEFQVNQFSENPQELPWVASFVDWRFVVVWSSAFQDGTPGSIWGRLFNADGEPEGDEFEVSVDQDGKQYDPCVATFSDGRFVVVWAEVMDDAQGGGLYGRLFNQKGGPIGSRFDMVDEPGWNNESPRVAVLLDGRFVVAWHDDRGDGMAREISARLIRSNGEPVGPPIRVNSHHAAAQQRPAVAALGRGGFVVVWESKMQDGDDYGVYGQLFDGDGGRLGGEFLANTTVVGVQRWPSVAAAADGRFVVTWTADKQDGDGYGVFGQFYAADGTANSAEFQANSYTASNQSVSSVAAFRDGRFVTVWISEGQAGPGYGAVGQIFAANGQRIGEEIQVRTESGAEQHVRSVATLGQAKFVVAWENVGSGSGGLDIYARILDVPE